jgi:hypothetical protein
MLIKSIKETGCNNILIWAIANGATNINQDIELIKLIDDELSYMLTIDDINFFELFRLTQLYRDRLRIINESQYVIPTIDTLSKLLPGVVHEEDDEKSLASLAEQTITRFMNISIQMKADDDIIQPNVARLFIPMICRSFCIQIPINFSDVIQCMKDIEVDEIFNRGYPDTLNNIIENDTHSVQNLIGLGFVKSTGIIKYSSKFDKYLQAIKYSTLKSYKENTLYKFALTGFGKKDNVNRADIKLSLFNMNPSNINSTTNTLKLLSSIKTPLELDFVVQLPIQYMQILENSFSKEILPMTYDASMKTIISTGLTSVNYRTPENIPIEDGEEDPAYTHCINEIENYSRRITESNEFLCNAINIILENSPEADITSIFAMLPSMYASIAVIKINQEYLPRLRDINDPVLSEMFTDMTKLINGVMEDIRKVK